ncbi:MAG: TIGR02996 domain-containing protein [Myxococcaceae bacterium]|nr:TIGR02996 domain-containing protein [Myxococcaceae bacterium]
MDPNEHVNEMFEAVWAAPHELDRRLVLADALLEAGDPRGEFIALQFETSARARKRAQKLLDRHRRRFLGRLESAIFVGTEVWRHGFVVSATVRLVGDHVELKAWATVERLVGCLTAFEPKELASPHLRSLRVVELIPPETVRSAAPWLREERLARTLDGARGWLAKAGRAHVLHRGREWHAGLPRPHA